MISGKSLRLRTMHVATTLVLALSLSVGCGSAGLRLGSGSTVNLNQLWGMVAQETRSYAEHAILAELEMTVAPLAGAKALGEQGVRIERLHFVAFASGPTVDVTATWPPNGRGQMSMKVHQPRNEPMPPPVGYMLEPLFSDIDYAIDHAGKAALLDGLQRHTRETTVRLRLVYPPPTGPYGQEWKVPLLVLRGRSVEIVMSLDLLRWRASSGVFQVLSSSSERLLAILVVED